MHNPFTEEPGGDDSDAALVARIQNGDRDAFERLVLRHASVSRLEAIPLGDGYTFSLTALSDVEHIPVADRTR